MIIRFGSTGQAVVKLQEMLGIGDDGYFGEITESEVIDFQVDNNLVPDGVVGPKTWEIINKKKGSKVAKQQIKTKGQLTAETFAMIAGCSFATAQKWAVPVNDAMRIFKITDKKDVAMFVTQMSHESSKFRRISENLNYSIKGLRSIFRKYFSSSMARKYGRSKTQRANQIMIASIAYANRMGNGNVKSRDGWKYRGKGPGQLTGKNNYRACGKSLKMDLILMPDDLLKPEIGALAFAWFWSANGLSKLAKRGQITRVSRRINGGNNGLSERKRLYASALSYLEDIRMVA